MTLKIQRSTDEDAVVFALSGRIDAERVAELVSLLDCEAAEQKIVLDLREVDLVDRDAVMFLGRCVADGIRLDHCPGYIREWIVRENDRNRDNEADAGESKSSPGKTFSR